MNDFSHELIRICRHFGMFERDAICCGTVTVPQCVALQALLEDSEPAANTAEATTATAGEPGHDISSLAALMGVSKSAMTRLVDGMEKRGWVERIRGAQARRRVLVQHTESGKAEALRLRGLTIGSVGAVLQHIPEEARAGVLKSMKLVRVALDKARAGGEVSCC